MKNLKTKVFIVAACIIVCSCEKKLKPEIKTQTEKKFYRVKQVDKDGNVHYSPVVSVKK